MGYWLKLSDYILVATLQRHKRCNETFCDENFYHQNLQLENSSDGRVWMGERLFCVSAVSALRVTNLF